MEFHKYVDSWSIIKKTQLAPLFKSREHLWDVQEEMAVRTDSPFLGRRCYLERAWIARERPYYNCYPAILPMLMKLKLDIPCSSIRSIAIEPIEVRLPKDQKDGPFAWGKHYVRTVIFGIQLMPSDVGSRKLVEGLCVCFDIGETGELDEPIYSFKLLPLREDLTIDEAERLYTEHHSATEGIVVPEEIRNNVLKLCACLSLISQDSELITPDILKKHEKEWGTASPERRAEMLRMARSRDKNGWNVGQHVEYSPHYRRPHPALVRFGKGRISARIVMRRGSVVHRAKLINMPSGYVGEDLNE
jgi:hypothetical protein